MRRTANAAGFSLIELMISMAILGVIMAQMFLVLSTQKKTYVGSTRTLDVQESARLVTDLIAFDTRMAGLMVPRYAGVSSVDGNDGSGGPTKNPDRFCVSDPDVFTIPTSATDNAFWDGRDGRFSGATTNFPVGQTFSVNSLDIDGDSSTVDFRVGSGAILSDGSKTYCSAITAINGLQITLKNKPPTTLFTTATVTVVPAIVYELTVTVTAGLPDVLSLTRNGSPLSSVIEDLQVQYWVDAAPPFCNGIMDGGEFWVDDLNVGGRALDRVRLVRVSVIARSELEDEQVAIRMARYKRPALANRVAGLADNYRRRSFTTSVLPRNLLARPDPTAIAPCANVP